MAGKDTELTLENIGALIRSEIKSAIRDDIKPLIKAEIAPLRQDINDLSQNVASLDRQIGRIDQRLSAAETELVYIRQQTSMIPDILEAIVNISSDVDDHEIRIRRLERA